MERDQLHLLNAVLPRGAQNGTDIPTLSIATGLHERAVREGLSLLLNDHRIAVCTAPRPNGIYVATTPEECDEADRNLRSRALAILRRRRALRLAGERLEYSETLF
jgi:hypothetical protein